MITGGSSGIGLALAKRFVRQENKVIICGRDIKKLESAKECFPELHIKCCDVAVEKERKELYEWTAREFPKTNVLFNNAGIQQMLDFSKETADWQSIRKEITINLEAPIHLIQLFIPHLSAQKKPVIVNVTSGLAFMPPIFAPLYGASKAGLHSFTFTLREQIRKTGIEVVEIIPPRVNTSLGGNSSNGFGMNVEHYADEVLKGLANSDSEVMGADSIKTNNMTRWETEEYAKQLFLPMIKDTGTYRSFPSGRRLLTPASHSVTQLSDLVTSPRDLVTPLSDAMPPLICKKIARKKNPTFAPD